MYVFVFMHFIFVMYMQWLQDSQLLWEDDDFKLVNEIIYSNRIIIYSNRVHTSIKQFNPSPKMS